MNDDHRIAAFVVSDEPYCPKAIMALLSLRKHNPDYDLFIAGNICNKTNLNLLDKYNIKLINVNYSYIFRQPSGTWPSEVWWLPLIPKNLYELGYNVSIGIDGDIYVVNSFEENVITCLLQNNFHMAGIKNGPISRYIKLDQWPKDFAEYICTKYSIVRSKSSFIQCTNSGFLFFNNEMLYKDNFYEKWINVYLDITKMWSKYSSLDIFKGDQEGFALLMPSLHFLYISPFYNFRFHDSLAIKEVHGNLKMLKDRLIAIHFVHSKPWYNYKEEDIFRYRNDIGNGKIRFMYIKKWQDDARNIFGNQCSKLKILELDKTHWSVRPFLGFCDTSD